MTAEGKSALERRVLADARELVARTLARLPGWVPPPVDPRLLAETLGIPVAFRPLERCDALIVPTGGGGYRIVCNPERRSRGRVNFSVAHEICHTFLPDAESTIHHRARRRRIDDPEQVEETLCDLGAAELLMPEEMFRPRAAAFGFRAGAIPGLASRFGVSAEAATRRLVELSEEPCAAGVFSYGLRPSVEKDPDGDWEPEELVPCYRAERVYHSPGFPRAFPVGKSVPWESAVARAVDREARGFEEIETPEGPARVEVSALPRRRFGRTNDFERVWAVFRLA